MAINNSSMSNATNAAVLSKDTFTYVESNVESTVCVTDSRLIVIVCIILSMLLVCTAYILYLVCKRLWKWRQRSSRAWLVDFVNDCVH